MVNGVWSRNASEARLKEETSQQAIPIVAVVTPTLGANRSSLDLPGRLEAYSRAPIYARVSGFLKAWYVDIGMPVKAGQLLAEIEAPDLDQQLLQAKAALASAQAAETLATVTAQRWQQLQTVLNPQQQGVVQSLYADALTQARASGSSARPTEGPGKPSR
mgnify:CR=1 FL=1